MGRPQRSMGHRRGREGTWAHTFHNLEKHSLSHPPGVGSRRRRHPLGALAFKAGPPPTHPHFDFPPSLFLNKDGGGKKSPSCRHASVSFGSPISESEKISPLFTSSHARSECGKLWSVDRDERRSKQATLSRGGVRKSSIKMFWYILPKCEVGKFGAFARKYYFFIFTFC